MSIRKKFLILLCLFACLTNNVHADWINLTGAETSPNIVEVYVNEDHVKLVMEVYIGDIKDFEDLVPDDWIKDTSIKRPPLHKRMQHFSQTVLQVRIEDNVSLPAEVSLVEPRKRIDRKSPFAGGINPFTRQRIPEAPADKRVLYAEIIYPFPQGHEKPKSLQIIPQMDEEQRPKLSIGFIAYHKSVPIIDFRYLGKTSPKIKIPNIPPNA